MAIRKARVSAPSSPVEVQDLLRLLDELREAIIQSHTEKHAADNTKRNSKQQCLFPEIENPIS